MLHRFKYVQTSEGMKIIGYTGDATEIVIPEKIKDGSIAGGNAPYG